MTHWNYRIVKHKDSVTPWFALHEVFYNKAGEAWAMTENPIEFYCGEEGKEGIIRDLCTALQDAIVRPVFEEPEKWAEPDDIS